MLKSTPEVNSVDEPCDSEVSLKTLFETEESSLLRYAFSLTGRRVIAEEIVQEVFLQLHSRWDEVDSPKAWLFRSVRNRAFDHLRKSRKEILQGEVPDGNPVAGETLRGGNAMDSKSKLTQEEAPDALMERMEVTAQMRQLIEQLSETDRQLVNLKYFEGMKYRQISEKTGLTISNVGYRLHHILKRLAGQLEPLGIDRPLGIDQSGNR